MSRHRSLVLIGTYTSHEALMEDVARLRAAGIEPVAGGLLSDADEWRLEVETVHARAAFELLGGESTEELIARDFACPRCQSTRGKAFPPYVLIAFVATVAAVAALAAAAQWWWLAGLVVVAGPAIGRLETHAPHWRCLNCGHAWNQAAEARRRADARRAAPE